MEIIDMNQLPPELEAQKPKGLDKRKLRKNLIVMLVGSLGLMSYMFGVTLLLNTPMPVHHGNCTAGQWYNVTHSVGMYEAAFVHPYANMSVFAVRICDTLPTLGTPLP